MTPPCGQPTTIDGKARYCERVQGHTGRHMTPYCGRRRYWRGNEGKGGATMPTGMAYEELDRSWNDLLRQVESLRAANSSIRQQLRVARADAKRYRQAKNKANQRTREARQDMRYFRNLFYVRTSERDAALKQSKPVGLLARLWEWLCSYAAPP
jgi:hypothetical protein